MKRIQLSKNFYLDEFTRSETATRHGIAVDIQPGGWLYQNVSRLVNDVLQPVRDALGPTHILSGYRPEALNKKIGGARDSQHVLASASDIVVTRHSPYMVSSWIQQNIQNFDQLILEFGQWTHVSTSLLHQNPRLEVLTAYKVPQMWRKPKTLYVPGLLTSDQLNKGKHHV